MAPCGHSESGRWGAPLTLGWREGPTIEGGHAHQLPGYQRPQEPVPEEVHHGAAALLDAADGVRRADEIDAPPLPLLRVLFQRRLDSPPLVGGGGAGFPP